MRRGGVSEGRLTVVVHPDAPEVAMIEHINPPSMRNNPAFSQGTIAPAGRTLYVGGQNGIDSTGAMAEGVAAQTAQAIANVVTVLDAAGATPDDVAKLTIHLAESVDAQEAYGAAVAAWGVHRAAVTGIFVARLALPGALVEIDAIAALPG
jgi:enamine deaminase RidA (YjgF/YER057c/UK114 family)